MCRGNTQLWAQRSICIEIIEANREKIIMTSEVTTYLKFANVQMAAEADYKDVTDFSNAESIKAALIRGNNRSSKFTDVQAKDFSDNWTVLDHKVDTSTGFSGTLFKYTGATDAAKGLTNGELVMSFRSTEFADDAARDNQATNAMEIRPYGWAFGQIADMENWYAELNADPSKLQGKNFSVTGYSLGGHLATAFDILRKEQGQSDRVSATYTFNGAGVGSVTGTLTQALTTFQQARANGSANLFAKPLTQSLYSSLHAAINGQASTAAIDTQLGSVKLLRDNAIASQTVDVQLVSELQLLTQALARAKQVRGEIDRVGTISNSGSGGAPQQVAAGNVDATRLDYQLAVLIAARTTSAYRTGLSDTTLDLANNARAPAGGLANVFDIYGDTSPSVVSNSQFHYGTAVKVAIEDQPILRGNVVLDAVLQSALYTDVKLLVSDFSTNDLGDTHSLVLLIDSLAVQNALAQLDGSFSTARFKAIFDAATNARSQTTPFTQGKAEGDALEKLLNDLARFVAITATPLQGKLDGGTWADIADRNAFYERLKQITSSDAFKALAGASP